MASAIRRILIHSAPPWAPSGYGVQARYLAQALRQLGYQVAISALAGCHETRQWNGVQILSCGTRPYGNGVIAHNYRAWKADLLISLGDLWVLDPEQLKGLNFMPILSTDCTPLSMMEKNRLDALKGPLLHPVAMSEFGRQVLGVAGFRAPVLPHCTKFRPDPAAGLHWRAGQHVPHDLFLVAKVGVNNSDDRKAFSVTMQAFAEFARDRSDVGLYLHCEAQAPKSPNLAYMAIDLGLKRKEGSKVVFCDQDTRMADGFGERYMHGLYCAADVLDATSKAEGFGVPAIEALACGTPVIGSANSAMPEKLDPQYSWLTGGQPEWAIHHHAWWQTPSVEELVRAYEGAYEKARLMREPAARAGQRWTFDAMKARLKEIISDIETGGNEHAEAFTEIYSKDSWGGGSGPGSHPAMAPEYIAFVRSYLQEYQIRRVLDLGCGDGRIADAIGLTNDAQLYTGLDITTGDDIRTCELPPADLVLIKDVFQHWPNADIQAMRERLRPYRHVLITNTISEQVNNMPANIDIPAGKWRAVDLQRLPFCWPCEEMLSWTRAGETKATVRLLP